MTYNGTTPLQPAVADLIGCSVKSQSKIAKAIKGAKQKLRIKTKARVLPAKTRIRIYKHLVKLYSQPEAKQPTSKSVQIIARNKVETSVKIDSQDNKPVKKPPAKKTPEATKHKTVNIISQVNNFNNVRVAFYVMIDGNRKRQVISLDGYFINALASINVLKANIPQWVQEQTNGWTAFDSKLPITRQIKYLIVREVVNKLSGDDSFFIAND